MIRDDILISKVIKGQVIAHTSATSSSPMHIIIATDLQMTGGPAWRHMKVIFPNLA